ELDADFLLLQEVQATDVARMAGALGMEHRYVPATFPPAANVRDGSPSRGNAILSRHPMTSATSLQHPGGGSFGLRVDAEVAGRRFTVACVHLSATWRVSPSHLRESGAARHREISHLLDDWQRRGAHPLI